MPHDIVGLLAAKPAQFWKKQGERIVLRLFHDVAEHVPAYTHVLQQHHIDHRDITTIDAFYRHVPILDKNSYIRQYSFDELTWPHTRVSGGVIYSSSGTTGTPTFWLRGGKQDYRTMVFHEVILRSFFHIDIRKTLFIDCFAMGIHVAGYITATAINRIAQRHPNVFLATPGSKKDDVLQLLHTYAPFFKQIVFIGYPPLIKDIVEQATNDGFNWTSIHAGFLFAAQGFTEQWRQYIQTIVHGSPHTPVVSVYGSADCGPMAFETPLSIHVRQRIEQQEYTLPFGLDHLPQGAPYLFQYIPPLIHIESVHNELLLSVDSGIPLVRYNIHDIGGIMEYGELMSHGVSFFGTTFQLPFVYVYGRSDCTVVFYGANVYPEHIHQIVGQEPLFSILTGKFVIDVRENEQFRQELHIALELKEGNIPHQEVHTMVYQTIIQGLCAINKEFLVVSKEMGKQDHVIVSLYPYGDPLFTSKNMKQAYVRKF